MALRAGMQVVCVDASWKADPKWPNPLQRGSVYTVTKLFPAKYASKKYSGAIGPHLYLLEIENPCPNARGFRTERFRPVKTTSIEIFRQMLVSPPKEVVDA